MEKFVFLFVIAITGYVKIICSTAANPTYNGGLNSISNALIAEENQFQYMISLQELSKIETLTRGHRCGGALITYQHVLTTASCTFNNNSGIFSPINPAEYRIFAGSAVLTNDSSADFYRSIANITVHPMFEMSRPFNNDIAVITLTSPFSEDVVVPVRMALSADDAITSIISCTVAGWGAQNETAVASTQLMYLNKAIFNQTICGEIYSELNNITVERNMICATTRQLAPSGCVGDSGNPLECLRHPIYPGRLMGLLTKTNDCTSSDNPEIYTRVSAFYGWVHQVIYHIAPKPVPDASSALQPELAIIAILAVIQITVHVIH